MFVYHVTTLKKIEKYKKTGFIKAPVRVWVDVESARNFSIQTGRKIIIRMNIFIQYLNTLEGHKGKAMYSPYDISMKGLEL